MSDDSFIREVDEELRSERVQSFWKRYGKLLIGLAVVLVLVTAAYRYWEYTSKQASAAAGDAFLAAIELDEGGKHKEALEAFKGLEDHGNESYKTMAYLRSAAILAGEGKVDDAVKQFDAVAADKAADENLRAIARIKAGMLLVDHGTLADVESRVSSLSGPGAPYRASAHEVLGLAYFKAGDLEKAFKQFEELNLDAGTPRAMKQRIAVMLAVIAANGGPVLKK